MTSLGGRSPWLCPLSDADTAHTASISEPELWAFLKGYLADAPGKISRNKDYWMSVFSVEIDYLFQEFGPEFRQDLKQ